MTLIDILDRPIAFHRAFVTVTGSVNAALMLSQAIYWSKRTGDPDGWFYKTAAQWELETGLTRHMQDGARKLLADVLEEKLAGMPATVHFRVSAENLKTWLLKSGKQVCRKAANRNGEKRQTSSAESGKPSNTETTSETTTTPAAKKSRPQVADEFAEQIYAVYPKKVAKPVAIRAIRKALKNKDISAVILLERTTQFAAAWVGADLTFCPNPSTWYNQQRYNDDPKTWKRTETAKGSNAGGNRNIGTANATRSGQYASRGPIRSVRLPQRSTADRNEAGGGSVSNGHA